MSNLVNRWILVQSFFVSSSAHSFIDIWTLFGIPILVDGYFIAITSIFYNCILAKSCVKVYIFTVPRSTRFICFIISRKYVFAILRHFAVFKSPILKK